MYGLRMWLATLHSQTLLLLIIMESGLYLYSQIRSKCIFIISDDGLFQSQHKIASEVQTQINSYKTKTAVFGLTLKFWVVKIYRTH